MKNVFINVFAFSAGILLWFASLFVSVPKYIKEPTEGEVKLWEVNVKPSVVTLDETQLNGGIGWVGEDSK